MVLNIQSLIQSLPLYFAVFVGVTLSLKLAVVNNQHSPFQCVPRETMVILRHEMKYRKTSQGKSWS